MMNMGTCMGVASRVARCTCNGAIQQSRWLYLAPRPHSVRALSTRGRDSPPHQSGAPTPRAQPNTTQARRELQLSTPPPPKEENSAKELRKPRNEEIKHTVVRLVNPETGVLDPPASLRQILSRTDRQRYYVELVQDKPEPIVKIFDKKLLYDREKAQKVLKASKKPPEEKEVQLTWGVGSGDLQFKLKKARTELEEGNHVNLVFAPKRGQKVPTPAEQEKLVEEALSILADVGKERRGRAVQKQAVAVFLEYTRPKKTVELRWTYSDNDTWEGLKTVAPALRSGARVEAIFILPPPPKDKKGEDDASAAKAVEPAIVQERVERTLEKLAEVGREWKPRDVRKTTIIAHLEGLPPQSESTDTSPPQHIV
ncbi:hypothetical protein OH77DRAFT_756278 [Trametes cingulata]|nr:hypothetical protein OH77DRAFT_756278 [Trametes cingulata]